MALALAAGCLPERDYMPLCVGNRWDYVVLTANGRREERRLEITRRLSKETWQAREGSGRELDLGGIPQVWSLEDEIVSVQQLAERWALLWLPPATGLGWWTQTPDGDRVWSKIVGREAVSVPAGTFRDCVVVVMERAGGRGEIRHWFAPGVGWVRASEGPAGGRPAVVRELVAWQLGQTGSDKITPLPERRD